MITDDALMAYLDGEADPARAGEIQAALAVDVTLRARLEAMAARDDKVRAAFEQLLERPIPPALADRVGAAVAASAKVVALQSRRRTPGRWAWVAGALVAQAAILVGAFVLIGPVRDVRAPTADYKALSASTQDDAANIVLMFHPDTREAAVREALASVGGRVVGGPNAAGAWMIRVPHATRDAALPRLRARPDVKMAEALDAP